MVHSVRRVAGVFSLLAFTATLALPLFARDHFVGDDVDLWGRAFVGHPVEQIELPLPSPAGDHCLICHWARLLGHSALSGRSWDVPRPVARGESVSPAALLLTTAPSPAAPRGPPANA